MTKRKAPLDEEKRALRSQIGRKAGRASWRGLTASEKAIRAYKIGIQGGRPRQVDRKWIVDLQRSGKTPAEIAAAVGCGVATVYRVLREVKT